MKHHVIFWLFTAVCTAAASPQILKLGNLAEPKTVDPAHINGLYEGNIARELFESLINKDPKTLELVPGAAEKWVPSDNNRKWTFYLRKNGKWSNGDPLTAQDFIYSWTRLLAPATASEVAYFAYVIKNGQLYNSGKTPASELGLKAIDKYTLEVILEEPTPVFLLIAAHLPLAPVHKATIEKYGDRWTRPENIVSNGAFKMAQWEINKVLVARKNPQYWDYKKIKLDEVQFFPVENLATEEKMFRTKQLHITREIPPEKVSLWAKDKTGAFQSVADLNSNFIWVNLRKGSPLLDKRVRKALALGIDRERLVKYVTKGHDTVLVSYVPPGTGGFSPKSILPKAGEGIKDAKRLLAEAGFPGGKDFPPIDFVYSTNELHKKVAEALQQMWKENLGLTVNITNQEWKVYLDSARNGHFQLARFSWIADYNDPSNFMDFLATDSGTNFAKYANPVYDKLIEQQRTEFDKKKRFAIFQQLEDIILDDFPVIPLYVRNHNYLKAKEVRGWYNNVEDLHPLKYVSLE
jgi:oligopeptide transport system substrate-binding protein